MSRPRRRAQKSQAEGFPKSVPCHVGDLEGRLGYQLRRAQEAAFKAFSNRVGDRTVWPGWYALLTMIGNCPNITPTALSQASGRDKSTLTASLRELTKAELIEKHRDPTDGRSFGLSLTEKGKAHLVMLAGHARAHDAQLDEIVGAENRDAVIRALRALADRLS